jgi:hypothetical protein
MKSFTLILFFLLCLGCEKEEEEPCIERICPDGFLNCFDRPCYLSFGTAVSSDTIKLVTVLDAE